VLEAGIGHRRPEQIDPFQVLERHELAEHVVGDFQAAERQSAQGLVPGELLQPRVADLREVQIERVQGRQRGEFSDACIADLGETQVQVLELLENHQFLESRIGDLRKSHVELPQVTELRQDFHVVVGHLRVADEVQVHRDDGSVGLCFIAGDFAAMLQHPRNGRRLIRAEVGRRQHACQPCQCRRECCAHDEAPGEV
jgi:hypothetical protein